MSYLMCLHELGEHGFLCECSVNANSIMNMMNTGALFRILNLWFHKYCNSTATSTACEL